MIGTTLGHYRVESSLGEGGMGEVYRARDTKLNRDVAIKVLPAPLANDPERGARFQREARTLAALNHANVAQIYGVEDGDGRLALVMELVDGPTLGDLIVRGGRSGFAPDAASRDRRRPGLPIDEAVAIARQVAEALEAAHAAGVIHRDLKPANIKVRPDGVVKVLDFGLAKLAPAVDAGLPSATASPTVTVDGTREGLIIGTPAYMSPEQIRGEVVDRRTDLWAFGCVLYETLTGCAAFARHTVSDTLAAVLEREPNWHALPDATPPGIRRLLRRCLQKDGALRLRDAGDARLELLEALTPDVDAPRAVTPGRRRIGPWTVAAGGLALAAAAILAWTSARQPGRDPALPVTRTTVTLPADRVLDTSGGAAPLAIAPDGRRLAYVASAGGRATLYIRNLDAFEGRPIGGSEGAQYPFFSPDGNWVAFFADRKLKRVSILGGSPLVVCDAPLVGRGGTWAPDGTIVFDPGDRGLMRVSAEGGRPEPLASRDATMDANNLSWPHFLPDGRTLLVTVGSAGGLESTLALLALETGSWHRLGPGSQAQYVPSGYLVYHAIGVREGEVHAVGFDPTTRTVRGAPAAVIDSVFRAPDSGGAYFAAAQNGTLIYTPGGYGRALVQVDRNGRRTPLLADRLGFRHPQISPDGLRVAVTIDPRPSQVWVYDIARQSRIAIAADGHNLTPVWTPDGRRLAYASGDIFWRTADAGSPPERLLTRDRWQYPTSWTGDGRQLIFDDGIPGQYDIWILPLNEEPRPLIATASSEFEAQISPDGHWLAYTSNESGRMEVYVRPFPDVNGGKWVISTAGGRHARWSPDGSELFYTVESALMAVAVETRGGAFRAGTPELLFSGPFETSYAQYAVAPDGRFIMVEADPNARPTLIQIVLNWTNELTRLAGTSSP